MFYWQHVNLYFWAPSDLQDWTIEVQWIGLRRCDVSDLFFVQKQNETSQKLGQTRARKKLREDGWLFCN